MSTQNEKKYDVPTELTKGDYAVAAARAGYSSIPIAGAAAAELFGLVVTPPLEKRRQEWMRAIGEGLLQLEGAGFLRLEDLNSNEGFISTVMHASHAAVRNHHAEKLEALRNAVLNSALPGAPEESLRQIFIYLVDQWTEWHVRILKLFQNPPMWFQQQGRPVPSVGMGSNIRDGLFAAYPDLRQSGFSEQIWKDLYDRGLMSAEHIGGMMSGGQTSVFAKRTTDLGDRFLAFITKPPSS